MGNNPSRSGGLPSRHRHHQDRALPRRAFSARERKQDYYRDYSDDGGDDEYGQMPHPQHYAPGFTPQGYLPPQYMNGQHLVFPQPQMQPGMNPVVPGMPTNGAMPTTGNPFPAGPMNMPIPDTGMPGPGPDPDAPVIPPMPSSHRRVYVPPHPYDSPSSDDELTAETRERLQPPLAPGQYGPYDRMRDRRGTPAPRPALRQPGAHRRALSSPMFGRDRFDDSPSPDQPVIPPPFAGGTPFPHAAEQPRGFNMQMPEPEPIVRPRPFSPLEIRHNPLPPPPRDIFQSSPYARLLRELRAPIDDIAIKERIAAAPAIHTVGAVNIPTSMGPGQRTGTRSSKEKKRKGLFRSFSTRLAGRRSPEHEHDVVSPNSGIPIQNIVGGQSTAIYPIVQHMPDGSTTLIYNPPSAQTMPGLGSIVAQAAAPPPGVVPMDTYAPAGGGVVPPPPVIPPGTHPAPPHSRTPSPIQISRSPAPRMPTPQPAVPLAIRIDRNSELAGLLHFSPHRVHYERRSYPTAAHLFEALKFLPARPDLAERVRGCGTPEEATAVAAGLREYWRQEWERDMLGAMEEVLYTKLVQHPQLRRTLMQTGHTPLVFSDPDTVWGDGLVGKGLNYLGRTLVDVRERFRAEGLDW